MEKQKTCGKKMNAEELSNYIISKPFGTKIDFAAQLCFRKEEKQHTIVPIEYLEEWYGVVMKETIFDAKVIYGDYYGGGAPSIAMIENKNYNQEDKNSIFNFIDNYLNIHISSEYVWVEIPIKELTEQELAELKAVTK